MQVQTEKLKILVEIIQELSRTRTLEDLMRVIRDGARLLVDSDGATFILREGTCCFYADENAIGPLWKGQRFAMTACISGWTMLHGETVILEDIYVDSRIPAEAYRPTFVKSLVMVPIRRENPIAAIGNYWAASHKASPLEVELLEILANSAAVTMENLKILDFLAVQVKELQIANQARDEFLQIVSHELRTPLNGIVGWASLLAPEIPKSNLPEYLVAGFEAIPHCSQALVRMISDLLDTTQVMTGKLQLQQKAVDFGAIAQATIENLRPVAEGKGIVIESPSRLGPALVQGDPVRLEQILGNLLSNAVKFTPEGGNIRVALEKEGPAVRITVSDSGDGIDAEFLPFVFDRFRQADTSATRRHRGMGIGLTIAKHLVEAQHGRISVSSAGRGKGTTFSVWFPLLAPNLGAIPSVIPRKNPSLAGVRVLAIDDDHDVCVLVSTILEQSGAEVRLANGAAEALTRLETFKPHVITCDLSMPEIDGFSFVRTLRQKEKKTVPVIALSAFADESHHREASLAGFDSFLAKPVEAPRLVREIAHFGFTSSQQPRMDMGSR